MGKSTASGRSTCRRLAGSRRALVDAVNHTLSRPKQLQVSSMYRVLRGQSLRCRHKNYVMQAFSRKELEELNVHLASFPGCMFVTQEPEEWKLAEGTSSRRIRFIV